MNRKWNLQKNTLFPSIDYSELRKNSDYENKFIDYLKIAYSHPSLWVERYLWLLKSDNSDNAYFEFKGHNISINSFQWNLGRGLKLFVNYNNIPVELCTIIKYEKGLKSIQWKILYSIEFKGQFYRLMAMNFFYALFPLEFCETIFEGEDGRIVRVDRTIDFMQKKTSKDKQLYIISPIQLLWKTGIRDNAISHWYMKGKAVKVYWNWWENLEKVDYWNRYYGSRKWKRVMLRVYDKIKDLSRNTWKWKELLYIDYMKMKKVVRVEFECQTRFCFGYTLRTLPKLLEKCDSVFHLSSNEWKGATCYEYKERENVIDLNNQSEYFKLRYFDSFVQHWFTIRENKINCFEVLIDWLYEKYDFIDLKEKSQLLPLVMEEIWKELDKSKEYLKNIFTIKKQQFDYGEYLEKHS